MRHAFLVLAFAALLAALAISADAACTYPGNASLCDPSKPGVDLPPELADVTITGFSIYKESGRYKVDLTLFSPNHPGEVKVHVWRWEFTDQRTWVAPAGTPKAVSLAGIDVGPAAPHGETTPPPGGVYPPGSHVDSPFGLHMLSIEWESNGETWHRSISLHRGPENAPDTTIRPGSYSFWAGRGTLVPWWLQP